jgi:hypothetical protein
VTSRRLLSSDEAEAVLRRHFRPAPIDVQILCGTYVVRWRRTVAESWISFEDAIRALARRRPDIVRTPLDHPSGLLKTLTEVQAIVDEPRDLPPR